jgi:hypothetical protein
MSQPSFRPGFQFSTLDFVVLCLGAVGAYLLGTVMWWAGAAVVFVVLHFFLFCNVFRITRASELIWAATFLLLSPLTLLTNLPGWPMFFIACVCLSTFLIWRETKQKHYHGICWQRWNPGLPEWWEDNDRRSAALRLLRKYCDDTPSP